VFAGRPEPDMHAWGNRFYKRVAAAAVLLCGLSLGVAVHSSSNGTGTENNSTDATERSNKRAPRERNVDVTGEITAFDLMNQNDGRLVTFTPTDAVEPTYEFSGVQRATRLEHPPRRKDAGAGANTLSGVKMREPR